MFGDVGDPQLVGAAAGEGALDEIGGDDLGSDPPPLPAARDTLQSGTVHQQTDLVVADLDAHMTAGPW